MLTPQQIGRNFENNIHNLLCLTDKIVLKEQEIVNTYKNNCFGVDHLIYCDTFMVCIQDKWTIKSPDITDAQHFISAMKKIQQVAKIKIIGIYISKTQITQRAYDEFKFEEKNFQCKIYVLCSENQNIIYKRLMKFLYSIGIFFFDNDKKTNLIMYDEEKANINSM